jgi:gliding motility-associated-like protein
MIGRKRHSLGRLLLFVVVTSIVSIHSYSQLYTKIDNADNLVKNVLLGSGVTVTSIKYNGASIAIGSFDGSKSNIGLSKGIIMTTGTIVGNDGPQGPNNSESAGMDNGSPGNGLLNQIIANETPSGNTPKSTFNAATLEIKFKPMSDTVRFRYVFGSEEYPEFVGSEFNDLFAFFISGPGISGQKNIALLPNGTPVTINNVNDQNNPNVAYYVNNKNGKTVQYDGFTRVLTAWSTVQCGKEYTLIITIADVGDAAFDSGIFLEANSLSAKVDLSVRGKISKEFFKDTVTMAEGCTSGRLTIRKLPGSKNKQYDIPVVFKGSATKGIDYTTTAPATLTILPNQDSVSIDVVTVQDNIKEGIDSIVMDFILPDACGNTYTVTKVLYIHDVEPITIVMPDDTVFCVGQSVTLSPVVTGGLQPYSYLWNTTEKTTSITVAPIVTKSYDVTVSDICFNSTKKTNSVIVMKYQPLQIAAIQNLTEVCPYLPTKVMANPSLGAGFYKYAWSDGTKVVDVNKEAVIKPPKTTNYTLTVTDRCGEKKSISFLYTITSPPLITHISPDTTICNSDSAVLIAGAVGGFGKYTYTWIPTNDTTSSILVKPYATSEYFVFVGDACKTFTVRDTVTVYVNKPPVSFTYQGTPITNEEIDFVNLSPKYPKYNWDFGNGTRSVLRDDKVFYQDSSVYDVTLSVEDSAGCKNATTQKIQIYYPYSLYVPNTFTPNGDGINDYFMPVTTSVVTVEFTIFNRWGEVIYYSRDLRPRWDGTCNGVLSPNDIYTYKIQVVNILEKLETYTGHVTLWR